MIQLGEKQNLIVVKRVEFGVYLAEEAGEGMERVLLPKKQVPGHVQIGDTIEVFIYKDSRDRLIATTRTPKILLHGLARLRVVQVGKIGAFLDWGLEKDLFLPFKEQTEKVSAGQEHLVALYIDKSNRLCATMNVYEYLEKNSPYEKDDKIHGTVYEMSRDFGAFVAVDDKYSGLIPKKEMYGEVHIGDWIEARVTEVKSDGKLDLSIRDKAYKQVEADAEKIMKMIESYDGVLPFNDKVNPDIIRRETQMSKNEFKRAVGKLLKNGRITITEKNILKIGD